MKNKKPLKENKFYIAAIAFAVFAVVCLVLMIALWKVGEAGQIFFAFLIMSIVAGIIFFSVGYAKNHPDNGASAQKTSKASSADGGHFNVWGDENWEQNSEEEKEWEDLEFFEMMEDD